jgi:hypothetical protein
VREGYYAHLGVTIEGAWTPVAEEFESSAAVAR